MSGIHQPPVPQHCPACGLVVEEHQLHACEVSDSFSQRSEKGPYNKRDDKGRFAGEDRRKPSSHMNDLRAASEALQVAAQAYRTTGDAIMKDSMVQALQRATQAVQGLIYDKEMPR